MYLQGTSNFSSVGSTLYEFSKGWSFLSEYAWFFTNNLSPFTHKFVELFYCSPLAFFYCSSGIYCIAATWFSVPHCYVWMVCISSVVTSVFVALHGSLYNQHQRWTRRFGMPGDCSTRSLWKLLVKSEPLLMRSLFQWQRAFYLLRYFSYSSHSMFLVFPMLICDHCTALSLFIHFSAMIFVTSSGAFTSTALLRNSCCAYGCVAPVNSFSAPP